MTSVGRSVAGTMRDSGHVRGNAPVRPGEFSYWSIIRKPKTTAATHPIASNEVVRIRLVVWRKGDPLPFLKQGSFQGSGNYGGDGPLILVSAERWQINLMRALANRRYSR